MSSRTPKNQGKDAERQTSTEAKIALLRTKEAAAYEQLHASLQAQIDTATAEIAQWEGRVANATGKRKAQSQARLEELQAKRDAAYEQLHASLQAQIARITTELTQLEGEAATATGDIKAQLAARIAALKVQRDTAQQYQPATWRLPSP